MQRSASISTSMGTMWEWLHSLWIAWTLPLGFTSWIAFFYIGWRARRAKWLLWGLLYFATVGGEAGYRAS